MKNNNSLSKFKQVLQLSGFKDVTERSESIQLEMAQGDRTFVITEEYYGSMYQIEYKDHKAGFSYMVIGNEDKAMDYIREKLMEVA